MLNKYARAFFTRVLTPFASFLIRKGVSPDTVTLIGTLGVVVGALVFFPFGHFFVGTLVITAFIFSDLVDGNMARQIGRSTKWGAFLDSTLDRVADAAIFGALTVWFAGDGDNLRLTVLCVICLGTGQVVSYTKARAESLGLKCDVSGMVERADRLVVVLVATGLDGLGLPYIQEVALWYVAVGSVVTVFQRMIAVRKEADGLELARPNQAPEGGGTA
ncbi:phosphatidylinositol phosphate synthase [Yinghuangia seranimata]|uniref:phosphatidylinositol phosphate synthase n=1 Tax=Yinghuangia seranimata TaxID=408067 RepID=UPI00248B0470|nr:CDP-alcohol phosphatidyltransferase family protein [Yinghuangia seranimata]MDI2132703.1 CDP-alcohol phosphatidyltransferase family protein [Yinghuangia seranimata]